MNVQEHLMHGDPKLLASFSAQGTIEVPLR